ncbi:MAG TPA: molybdopterin cofactor-binding domain-containing protein [Vicinamibacteria bacterium]|nr:molybdopterin cofactor-binding domain-containing protein [Vicinamibacteria bacterium]
MPEQDRRDLSVIGRSLPKVDAAAKVTGQTVFADDLVLPRMAWARLLRSPHPHARIKRLDVTRAAAHPGVLATLVGRELPIPFGILPVSQDEHALALDTVRFVGDPVAAVAALDEETAEAALALIDVEYEVLPASMSIEEALGNGHARIQDYGSRGNVHKEVSFDFGDVEQGFAEADHLREDTFFFEGNTHLPMEQHACVAQATPDGKVTLWSSTQTPHYVHRALAKVLEMPPAHIRVIACPNGGGFGGKSDPFGHEIVACKLSLKTGRPVKITLTREEVFYCHRGRHPVRMWIKTGLKKDGSITAMHFRSALDGGAYGSYGVASLYYTGALQTVTYHIPRYRFDGVRVFTNKPPCGPKRGHGTPQPRWALECHIERFCRDLGLDPAQWRLRHTLAPGTITANQMKVRTIGLRECLERVAASSGFHEKYQRLGPGRGIGIAGSAYISGAGLPIYWNAMPHSGVQIKVDRGGGVAVFCGSTDIGQGSDSVLAYVVAEELGIRPEDIRVVTADTDLTPVDLGSYSSRVTLMTGNAAIQAARRVREPIFAAAARKLECPPERLRARDRRIFDVEDPARSLSFAEAAVLAEAATGTLGAVGSYTPPRSVAKWKGAGVGPTPTYSYSAAVVELTADRETGMVRVDKVWIAHDVGKALNPVLVIGQVEGSVYMGLGEALMEEQVFRRGLHKVPSMLEYKSPTTLEMPPVESILVETLDPEGPYGGKECGQGPLLPVIPAVTNALRDALGIDIDEVPITPEKVMAALEGRYRSPRMPEFDYPPLISVPPLEAAAPAAAPVVDPALRP